MSTANFAEMLPEIIKTNIIIVKTGINSTISIYLNVAWKIESKLEKFFVPNWINFSGNLSCKKIATLWSGNFAGDKSGNNSGNVAV